MGRPKLLLPYGGGTVLGATVAALRGAGVSPIVVVASAGDAPLRAWCAAMAATGSAGAAAAVDAAATAPGEASAAPPAVDGTAGTAAQSEGPETAAGVAGTAEAEAGAGALIVALNPAPERGMLSSILEGLAALGGAGELAKGGAPLLVCPGDLPALRAATVAELQRRLLAAGAGLAVPVWRGRRGHPLAIAPSLIPKMERLDPGRGLRHLLDLHAGDLLRVEVNDPGCLADLDTPEDYERLRAGAEKPPGG